MAHGNIVFKDGQKVRFKFDRGDRFERQNKWFESTLQVQIPTHKENNPPYYCYFDVVNEPHLKSINSYDCVSNEDGTYKCLFKRGFEIAQLDMELIGE